LAQQLEYDEWGQPALTNGTMPGQPFGSAGGLYDADTGFVRFGARDYDPAVGRWTSKDASRFAGGLNFYAYANDDPVNYIDVDGRNPIALAILDGFALTLATDTPSLDSPHVSTGQAITGVGIALGVFGGGGLLRPGCLHSNRYSPAAAEVRRRRLTHSASTTSLATWITR